MLLDMDMPNLTGFDVLEALRSTLTGRSVPVIVVTAHDDPETESRCIELGAEDYITKPIQPATLIARIRAVLRRVGANYQWPTF
jgi:two-component system cell cycle response regulator CtrA